MSPFPIPCVSRQRIEKACGPSASTLEAGPQAVPLTHLGERYSERGEDDWVRDINLLLKFNASFGGRGTLSGNGGFEDEEE